MLVIDINEVASLHSLISRSGVWYLDVNDLDAMDPKTHFQYLAYRPSPDNDLVLSRVPELRNLVYVKYNSMGKPYPIYMRRVASDKKLTFIPISERFIKWGHRQATSDPQPKLLTSHRK